MYLFSVVWLQFFKVFPCCVAPRGSSPRTGQQPALPEGRLPAPLPARGRARRRDRARGAAASAQLVLSTVFLLAGSGELLSTVLAI